MAENFSDLSYAYLHSLIFRTSLTSCKSHRVRERKREQERERERSGEKERERVSSEGGLFMALAMSCPVTANL